MNSYARKYLLLLLIIGFSVAFNYTSLYHAEGVNLHSMDFQPDISNNLTQPGLDRKTNLTHIFCVGRYLSMIQSAI